MSKRIKELAEQAAGGLLSYHAEGDWYLSEKEVEKFSKLIRADEREACARTASEYATFGHDGHRIAIAIRAKGEVK